MTEFAPGTLVGDRWKLVRHIGSGGMAHVWEASDEDLHGSAAIKIMHAGEMANERGRKKFLDEARAAHRAAGQHVVGIHECKVDRESGVPYIAMELLRGEDLGRRLARGRMGYLEMVSVITDVCTAMKRPHQDGMVHRDLKPANVFLVADHEAPHCKVLDFGFAKLTAAAVDGAAASGSTRTPGTLCYMSPEQLFEPQSVDQRADVWAIGVLAYECVTGKSPLVGETIDAVIDKMRSGNLPRPSAGGDLPIAFDEWFAKATARDPADRFADARAMLEALREIQPPGGSNGVTVPPSEPRPRHHLWASDANQIDISRLDQVVFRNAVVDEFLGDERKWFISGAKGLGKTLLLTYKRSILQKRYQSEGRGADVRFVPEGRPYLDLMADITSPSKQLADFLSTLGNCKRIWRFALRASALSHHGASISQDDRRQLDDLPRSLASLFSGNGEGPTLFVKGLFSQAIKRINQILEDLDGLLERKFRSLHSGVFFFIDKVDQALGELPRAAWIHMQAGLVEAAWDLMNTNPHIKVFTSVREEAFRSYESPVKTSVTGAVTRLRYSIADRRAILERLTDFYEGLPLRDFVSVDTLSTNANPPSETAFDLLDRHTLGRPRDLVVVAAEISRNRRNLDERAYKEIVRETTAGLLASNVFSEMASFLEVLSNPTTRTQFFRLVRYGILDINDMVDVWCALNRVDREYYDVYGAHSDDAYHPWRELYDCGLLGVVEADLDGTGETQRFGHAHESLAIKQHALPPSHRYLLHPAVEALLRKEGDHRVFRGVLIGDRRPWLAHYDTLIDVQHAIFRSSKVPNRRVDGALIGVLDDFQRLLVDSNDLHAARQEVGTLPSFAILSERLEKLGWEDAYLQLHEAFGPH